MSAPSALTNSAQTYGGITKMFHWLTALLIFTAFPLGMIANDWAYDSSAALATKGMLFSLHKTIGVTTFFVALARILWAISQPKPGLLHPERKLESFAAETVHWALYGALVLVPLSGWLHHAATAGFAPIWWPFGQTLPMVPQSDAVAGFFGAWHEVFTKILLGAVALHVAGALKHHVIDRDATLRRMLPGKRAATPDLPPQVHSRAPLLGATLIWAGAIALGSVLGLAGHDGAPRPGAAAIAAVPSDWAVQSGTLAISVRQFGSDVTGQFDSWNAAITFDPDAATDPLGHVDVQIAIGSLTLGSVTDQAMGPEFFDAEAHPTATFAADIRRDGTDYVADGTLTMKGHAVPLSLPFTLTLEGDTATMQGTTTLDRRDFEIGTASYGDEGTVGFGVTVTVALTASRAATGGN